MLRLILGRAGTGKTGLILDELNELVRSRRSGGWLIVPEQYSHEAERELAERCGDTACLYAEVVSFTRLAYRVSVSVGGSARTYIDRGGRLLQLALALDRIGGTLEVYGSAARRPELMSPLLTALDELRYGRADSGALRAAASELDGPLAAKLRDLALIRETLDALEASSGADPASRLDILAEQIPGSGVFAGAEVYIDGFTDFTAQERAVIRALWNAGADVTVALSCDFADVGSEVFSSAVRTARELERRAAEDGIESLRVDVPSRPAETAMGFLETHLFGWTDAAFPAGDSVRMFTAPTVAEECELAAAEALRLVRERGCRWRDIAVAVRGFDDCRGALADAFRRCGIPLYATARTDIFTRPLPALIGAAFDLLSDGWSYESMFTYLKSGLADITREECDLLENYVLTWEIRGTAWTREAPWHQHPDGYNADRTAESDARLVLLDALRRRVAAPLERFARRGKLASTARGQCEAVAEFWEDIGLAGRLEEHTAALERSGESQAAAEYGQLWELMVSALEQCAAVLGDMPMTQEEFGRLFRRMLSEYDVGTIPITLDQVIAGDFDRMRRRRIRHLLLLGASDDRIPRISEGEGVFSDAERDRLRLANIDLASADDVLDREFNLIYNVLTLPSETLTVFRSLTDAKGERTRPSFLTDRLGKLFGCREIPGDMTAARLSAPGPALELAVRGEERALRAFAGDPGALSRISRLRASAEFTRGRLSERAVRALYGDKLWLTASRVDNFASCKYQYFLRYGLKAKPRQAASFSPPELGTFLHYLLENVAKEANARGGFAELSEEEIGDLTERYAREYVHTELEDYREKTPRFIYLFERLVETSRRIVLDTARELKDSDFKPLAFELDFSKDVPPVELGEGDTALALTGRVDRVDSWEHDGKLYLRVVDYKSGVKKFSFSDVEIGLGLQMLLYLFSLQKNSESIYGRAIEPAGVLYVPARDVIISADSRLSDEEIEKKKAAELKRSGLLLGSEDVLRAMEHSPVPRYLPVRINKDGEYTGDALATAEQLGHLSAFVDETLKEMAGQLRAGSISADPLYKSERDNTCLYCDYFSACRFDGKTEQWRRRKTLKAPEFWNKIDPENKKEGGDVRAADD